MTKTFLVYTGSILMMLLFSCKPVQTFQSKKLGVITAPQYLSTSSLAPVRHVQWYLNDQKVLTNEAGEILLTKSGNYQLTGKYFFNGNLDSITHTLKVLPPENPCLVAINTTKGSLVVELSGKTPRHSDHFEDMVRQKYYDGLIFHRVIPGFVVQGGDGSDTSHHHRGPSALAELAPEFNSEMLHYKGALAMARMPDNINPEKNSSADQFYLVHGGKLDEERLEELTATNPWNYKSYQKEQYLKMGGSPQLDSEYTVFGYVTHGYDILDSLALSPTGPGDLPLDTIFMTIRMVE